MSSAMGGAKPIRVTKENVAEFLQEFDSVVSDCDGVIWTPIRSIPGAKEGFERLRDEGKKVFFVTNNSAQPPHSRFHAIGFPISKDEAVHPALAIAHHLQRIGFRKKAYVLAGEAFRQYLREVGVVVGPEQRHEPVPENIGRMLDMIEDDPDVGAVIVDCDLNISYLEITRAVNYLRRPDCLFFTGATDKYIPLMPGKTFLGPGYFSSLIEEISGRQSVLAGKPGTMMVQEYIKDHHHIDLARSIFVGDTLLQDMGVANACGMKKLLVLSGVAKLEDLDTCDPALVPDYYIESMGELAKLLAQRASL